MTLSAALKWKRPAPLNPLPDNHPMIKRVVAVYTYPLDKFGRRIPGMKPMWMVVSRWIRELYQRFAEMGRKDGAIFGCYAYIGELMGVTPERARQQVNALIQIGWAVKQHRVKNDEGWFDSNLYGLVDPLAPLNALAVAIRTDGRRQRYQTVRLTQQDADIPEFRAAWLKERLQPERDPNAQLETTEQPARTPMVILPELYRKIAEAEGLTDPRLQSEAWKRYEAATQSIRAKGKQVRKPGALWRFKVREILAEFKDEAQQPPIGPAGTPAPSTPNVISLTEKERQKRRAWLLGKAMRELLAGGDPGKVAAALFAMPELHSLCRLTPCPLEEIVALVQESERALRGESG